jgi:hypothetical protein
MILSTILTIGIIVSVLLFIGAITYFSLKLFKQPPTNPPTNPPTKPPTNPPTNPPTSPPTNPPKPLTCANMSDDQRVENIGNTFQNVQSAIVTGPDGKCYETSTNYPAMCADIMKLPSNVCTQISTGVTLANGMKGCNNLYGSGNCNTKVDPTKYCVCPYGCAAVGNKCQGP